MDSTEAQLRFGASLTHSSDPQHPNHPFHTPASGKSLFSILLESVMVFITLYGF